MLRLADVRPVAGESFEGNSAVDQHASLARMGGSVFGGVTVQHWGVVGRPDTGHRCAAVPLNRQTFFQIREPSNPSYLGLGLM
jgi:hypothetical protein